MTRLRSPADLERWRADLPRPGESAEIAVCAGTGCRAAGGEELLAALRDEGARAGVRVRATGCHGFCEQGPLAVFRPSGALSCGARPEDAADLVARARAGEGAPKERRYRDPATKRTAAVESDVRFYAGQTRVVLAQNGRIDPESLEDYVALGGWRALARALVSLRPEDVVGEIERSGLRGRGGAGYPTGRKWRLCRAQAATPRYVVANADEGDPGAYMDRSLVEGDPHAVLEGIAIGAWAIGASAGFVYIREEYPLALRHLATAVARARAAGLLGEDILGTGFSFDVEIVRGSGAFVCGEETALIASIEGRPGEPVDRPPYPVERGLWGKPTCINNVETWANVPPIVDRGAEWFRSVGTPGSPGTKIFSLVGKVNATGLVEVPMGTTLRALVHEIGGGIRGRRRRFKAVQTGGPSGGVLPERLLDLPVDFEALSAEGAIMGSGGLVVMDDRTCMVDVARFFLHFLLEESCGKCVPCREGLRRLHALVDGIASGRGRPGDIERIEVLGEGVRLGSLCGLGKTAPNPVASTIRHFRDEYDAHILEKRCPAGVCRELTRFEVVPEACTGCTLCIDACPSSAVEGKRKVVHSIVQDKCARCGACFDVCAQEAIRILPAASGGAA